jgi:hypothetical protein
VCAFCCCVFFGWLGGQARSGTARATTPQWYAFCDRDTHAAAIDDHQQSFNSWNCFKLRRRFCFGCCGGWCAQVAYFGAMLKLYLEGKPVFNCIDNDLGY